MNLISLFKLAGSILQWMPSTLIIVHGNYKRSVKGAHQRYVYATACWALLWPSVGALAMWLVQNTRDHSPMIIFSLINTWIVWSIYRDLKNNDDDNLWKKMKKGLKKKIQALRKVRLRVPVLAPMPTGA